MLQIILCVSQYWIFQGGILGLFFHFSFVLPSFHSFFSFVRFTHSISYTGSDNRIHTCNTEWRRLRKEIVKACSQSSIAKFTWRNWWKLLKAVSHQLPDWNSNSAFPDYEARFVDHTTTPSLWVGGCEGGAQGVGGTLYFIPSPLLYPSFNV